jgi:hypothetical protein
MKRILLYSEMISFAYLFLEVLQMKYCSEEVDWQVPANLVLILNVRKSVIVLQ